MKVDRSIEIIRSKRSVLFVTAGMAIGFVLLGPSILFATVYPVLGCFTTFLILDRYFIKNLELLFNRGVSSLDDEKIFIHFSVFVFSALKKNCVLEIIDISFPTRLNKTVFGLVITRNRKWIFGGIFKNRIKICLQGDGMDIEKTMIEMAERFGLDFIPFEEKDVVF